MGTDGELSGAQLPAFEASPEGVAIVIDGLLNKEHKSTF